MVLSTHLTAWPPHGHALMPVVCEGLTWPSSEHHRPSPVGQEFSQVICCCCWEILFLKHNVDLNASWNRLSSSINGKHKDHHGQLAEASLEALHSGQLFSPALVSSTEQSLFTMQSP